MRDRLLAAEKVKAIDWRDDALYLLDQRILPFEETWLAYTGVDGVAQAIRDMVVRGAPAIGIAAAYGVVLAARARKAAGGDWLAALEEDFALLADSRPTAVNLFWALNRMRERLARSQNRADVLQVLEAEAVAIHESDREANLTMAQLGVDVIRRHQGNAQAVLRDYDVVLNSLGPDALAKSLKILKPGGQLISISGPPTPAFARAQNLPWVLGLVVGVLSSGIRRKARKQGVSYDFVFMRASGAQLDEITTLVESGIIRPVIDRTFPFESTAAALDYVEQGRAKGKVVITMETAPPDAHPAG